MDIIQPLLDDALQLIPEKLDVFHYMAETPLLPQLPYNIRVFLRQRMASQLGKALHNQHTLAVALRTAGGAIVNNQFLQMAPGSALLIFPREVHYYIDTEQEEVLWLFCGFLLDDNESYASLRDRPVMLCDKSMQELQAILHMAFCQSSPCDSKTLGMRLSLRVKLLLEQLLDNRWQELPQSDNTASAQKAGTLSELVTSTCQYISSNVQKAISIEDIAAHLHVSPGHLRNEFRRRAGCSLGHYIRYLKMHNACTLINTTALSLAEIGERCGYSSIYAFSRAFKNETGISPSEYRNLK